MRLSAPRSVLVIAIALSCASFLLWMYSGCERLTKSAKPATVTSVDPLFGDPQTRIEMRPGPVFGWYIGLDAVGAAIVFAIAVVLVAQYVSRTRQVFILEAREQFHAN